MLPRSASNTRRVVRFAFLEFLLARGIDRTCFESHEIQRMEFRVIRRRKPIRCPRKARAHQGARWCWFGTVLVKDRPAFFVDSSCPIELVHKWRGGKEFSGSAIQHIQETVPIGLQK